MAEERIQRRFALAVSAAVVVANMNQATKARQGGNGNVSDYRILETAVAIVAWMCAAGHMVHFTFRQAAMLDMN